MWSMLIPLSLLVALVALPCRALVKLDEELQSRAFLDGMSNKERLMQIRILEDHEGGCNETYH